MGRDSSVGIATNYWLDGPGIESRWGARFSALHVYIYIYIYICNALSVMMAVLRSSIKRNTIYILVQYVAATSQSELTICLKGGLKDSMSQLRLNSKSLYIKIYIL